MKKSEKNLPSGETAIHEGVLDPGTIKMDTNSARCAKSLWGNCSSKHWFIPLGFLCGVFDMDTDCLYCHINNLLPQTTHAYPHSDIPADMKVFPVRTKEVVYKTHLKQKVSNYLF